MANPDQPIPEAPKDWMPPMPRPESPPAEDSDHDSDAGNEVSHSETPLLLLRGEPR